MPDIVTSVNYLKDLPLYKKEKPYLVLLPASGGFELKAGRTDNLEYESHDGIHITDMRGREKEFQLITHGFEIMPNTSSVLDFRNRDDVQAYKQETEEILKAKFGAEKVVCWDFKARAILFSLLSLLTIVLQFRCERTAPQSTLDLTSRISSR